MNKIITAGCVAVAAFAAVAMPNKRELAKAQRLVEDVTKADLVAFKAGKKPAKDVAKAHILLAEKAENQAEKYLLYQGAFKLYARCEEYDLAADALRDMQREVKDVPPEVIAELVSDELRYVPDAKAPQLVAVLKEAKGKEPTAGDADEKLYLDVVAELRRKGGSEKERTNIVLSKLFPGWTLAAGERMGDTGSFTASHRGKNNVFCSHPISEELPMILIREVKLPVKNPCLFLTVSSFDQKSDCLLTVRVNGKDALPARRVNTPDNAPWEDVVVPLSAWSGQKVKIELVHSANNWYCEHLYLSRIKIAEGSDGAQVVEGKATVDGYTWSYRVKNGEAEIVSEKDGKRSCAVSPNPNGHLVIPATIEGVKVTSIGEHAFFGCGELNSVTIPVGVKNICNGAFYYSSGLTSISISSSVTDIVPTAFVALHSVKSFSVASDNPSYSSRNGLLCSKDGSVLVAGVNGDVTIPSGVKTIGRQSFLGRGLNMTVTIPSSVTKIEERAFAYCLGLTSVTMCGERPEAPDNAFNNCGQLTAIHVPANAKSWAGMKEWQGKPLVFDEKIDTSGFDHEGDPQEAARKAVATLFPGWSLDTEIAPNPRGGFCDSHRGESNVMYIHPKAEGASAIVSRTMKLSNKNPCLFLKTASWSEDNMDFLLSVRVNGKEVMPKRRICTPDFEPWKELTIPLFAWRGRVAKVEVVLTANGWWYEFPFFKRIEIAEGTGREKFVAEAKETVDGYTWSYRVDNGDATIISEKNGWCSCAVSPEPTGSVSVPATLGGFRVTSIGTSAFLRCKELKSVVIPTGVTSIGWCSFYGCGGLDSVTIPDGVIGIERGAFSLCFRLSSAVLPPSVVDIGIDAFTSCSALTSVTIPCGVKVIKGGSFSGCCGLRSLTIPMGVEVIKSGAFSWYCGFKTVSISASVTNIEQGAFIDCKQIESFAVDAANPAYCSINGLLCSKDGSRLVAGVNGDVVIPDGVTTIGADAFHGCFGLRTATIPSSVTNIGYWAFSFIDSLNSIRVDEANRFYKSVNGLLLTKDGKVLVRGVNGDVTIPAGVKTIEDAAFSCCKMNSVTIPEGVENITRNAFVGCRGIKSVTIPSTVKDIGMKAFENCGDLTDVTMCGEKPGSGKDVFRGCGKLTAIHVPANEMSWAGMKEWQGKPLVFDAK